MRRKTKSFLGWNITLIKLAIITIILSIAFIYIGRVTKKEPTPQIQYITNTVEKPIKVTDLKDKKGKLPKILAEIGTKRFYKITGNSFFGINVAAIIAEDTETGEITIVNSFAGSGAAPSIVSGAALISASAVYGTGFDKGFGSHGNDIRNNLVNNNNNTVNLPALDTHSGQGHHKN